MPIKILVNTQQQGGISSGITNMRCPDHQDGRAEGERVQVKPDSAFYNSEISFPLLHRVLRASSEALKSRTYITQAAHVIYKKIC